MTASDSDSPQRAIVIAISGCSSSGKTTLARLLRDLLPETFIIHEDDFYKPEAELPIKDGLVDWDCPEAIAFDDLERALRHVREKGTYPVSGAGDVPPSPSSSSLAPSRPVPLSRRSDHGCVLPLPHPISVTSSSSSSSFNSIASTSVSSTHIPSSSTSTTVNSSLTIPPTLSPPGQQPFLDSKEDLNSVGPSPVTPDQIACCRAKINEWLSPGHPGSLIFGSPSSPDDSNPTNTKPRIRLCILDGFLLYTPTTTPPPSESFFPLSKIQPLLDIKLFLTVSKSSATRRREARDGYVTLEGFWKDPPGYVEKIVWPNYVEAHKWMFEGGDVERGVVNTEVADREGVRVMDTQGRGDVEFGEVLKWAVGEVMGEVERLCLGDGK